MRLNSSIPWRILIVIMPLSLLGLLTLSGCLQSNDIQKSELKSFIQPAVFVGSAACADCHASEFRLHSHSRHAQTFHALSQDSPIAPPLGDVDKSGFFITTKEGKFQIGQASLSDETVPLDYALGSGKTGITYVARLDGGRLAEFRKSFFPQRKEWYTTPGHEQMGADELGKVHSSEDGRRCLMCHAVTVDATTLQTEERFFGVGCESCHGAGSEHIQAARTGQLQNAPMEKLENAPADQINLLCGKCHGQVEEIAKTAVLRAATNRFQVYGLAQSRCFQKSGNALSCLTCHNPHTNASTRTADYEAKCLNCHASKKEGDMTVSAAQHIKVCPKNPNSGCIDCHMPSKSAIPGTKLPTLMADHFIRIQK